MNNAMSLNAKCAITGYFLACAQFAVLAIIPQIVTYSFPAVPVHDFWQWMGYAISGNATLALSLAIWCTGRLALGHEE